MTTAYDLVIVGAGPAGLSAALTAAQQQLRVLVIDEQQELGGQIFRQPPSSFQAKESSAFKAYPFGRELLEAARASSQIDWKLGSTAWGIFRSDDRAHWLVGAARSDSTELVRGTAVLIATGAYDMPVAFPGWTLPGVMSAGGVQTMIKSQFLLPGKRFVLAGSHPLLLLVAELLLQNGAQISEIAIARPFPSMRELINSLKALPGQQRLMLQFAQTLRTLRKHRVPIHFSTLVTAADGTDAVQRVTLCDADANWKVLDGTQRHIEADTLVVGYGLLASSELARQAGCESQWRVEAGGWIIQHDDQMRTSQPGIYVAGEPAGIGGAAVAYFEGKLAALSIIAARQKHANGHLAQDAMTETRSAIRHWKRFTETVNTFFAPKLDALALLAQEKTLVCRCEEVSAGDIHRCLDEHPHITDVNSLKLACRSGMGPCQGRYCQHSVSQILASKRGQSIETGGMFTARAPVKPVAISALTKMSNNAQLA